MTTRKRIGVLFNVTEKSARLLAGLRRQYPDAHITAVVPVRAQIAPGDMEGADTVLPVELSPLRLVLKGMLFRVAGQLRECRFDLFILRFGTLKLRLLASLVAPGRCELWLIGGIIAPVDVGGIIPAVKDYFRGWWSGRRTLMKAWCNTRFYWVRSDWRKR